MSLWTEILAKFEKTGTPNKIRVNELPEMLVGGKEIRVNVFTDDWQRLIAQVETLKT